MPIHIFNFFRGQNALHTLAQYAKENAASIFEIFRLNLPNFPINAPDAEENTGVCLTNWCHAAFVIL